MTIILMFLAFIQEQHYVEVATSLAEDVRTITYNNYSLAEDVRYLYQTVDQLRGGLSLTPALTLTLILTLTLVLALTLIIYPY